MSLEDIVSLKLGQKWEVVDSTNLNQCFDLVVGWADNLGIPRSFQHLYAYQIYANATSLTRNYYELIPNTPLAVPKKGDIVVWGRNFNGGIGHTAVATGFANLRYLEVFSQNDPIMAPCILKTYTYDHILGWLRPKVLITSPTGKPTVKQLSALLTEAVSEKRWE